MNRTAGHFTDLLWAMTVRDLRLRYKKTTLGFLWVLLYPIMQATVIGYIFTDIFVVADANYPYMLFLNLLIWNFFSGSLENATQSIVSNRTIVKKARFAYVVVPLSVLLSNFLHMLFPLALFGLLVATLGLTPGINLPLLLAASALLLAFTGGLSLATAALHVKRRDIGFLTRAFLMVWFYATPVIYAVSDIPDAVKHLWSLNPLTGVLMMMQHSFFRTPIYDPLIPANIILTVLAAIMGVWIFGHTQDYFDDHI